MYDSLVVENIFILLIKKKNDITVSVYSLNCCLRREAEPEKYKNKRNKKT